MTTQPVTYNLVIYQGATFSQNFTWQDSNQDPVDLTGYTARMMARTTIDAAEPFIDLTTENSGITLGGAAGTVTLSLSATLTSALEESIGLYDLELVSPGGEVTRFLQGMIAISREVTR